MAVARVEAIQERFEGLLGKPAWNVKKGIGSFITMEFGQPIVNEGGHVHGEWHLWVYDCAWRLETQEKVLAASEDEPTVIENALHLLNGLAIENIALVLPSLESSLSFEQGYALRLFPVNSSDVEHWMLFTPEGKVLVIGPGMDWSYQDADR
jgi:hypothetical protein